VFMADRSNPVSLFYDENGFSSEPVKKRNELRLLNLFQMLTRTIAVIGHTAVR